MDGITTFILILVFTAIYIFLIEVFTILFRITGLTREKSRFQAISLLTNCGFTTNESEIIMNNKARRRLAIISMITGYIYSVIIVSLFINLLNHIEKSDFENNYLIIIVAICVFIVLILIAKLKFVKRGIEKVIEFLAKVILKKSKKENIITQLDVYGSDEIVEVEINDIPEMMKDKNLSSINLRELYKLNILLLKRKNKIVEITKDTIFQNGDKIIIFGSHQNIVDLFKSKVKDMDLLDKEDRVNENVIELIDNYGIDAMAEVSINSVPKILENVTLFDSGLKEKYLINILMIKRNDRPLTVTKDTVIEMYDNIIVFGPYKNIKNIFLNNENEQK